MDLKILNFVLLKRQSLTDLLMRETLVLMDPCGRETMTLIPMDPRPGETISCVHMDPRGVRDSR